MHTHIGTENYDINPNWVSPPGETIKDLLEDFNMTVIEVEALIKGNLEITKTTASTEFWINREGLALGFLYE